MPGMGGVNAGSGKPRPGYGKSGCDFLGRIVDSFQEAEPAAEARPAPVETPKWPNELQDRASAIRTVIAALNAPAEFNAIAAAFQGKRTQKRLSGVREILKMRAELGQIRRAGEKRYAAE